MRGLALDADDLLRRDVIMALMCQGRLDFAAIERAHRVRMPEAFAAELAQLDAMVASGLVTRTPDAIEVTASGWYVVRAVAMVFDRYLQGDRERGRFSRIL